MLMRMWRREGCWKEEPLLMVGDIISCKHFGSPA